MADDGFAGGYIGGGIGDTIGQFGTNMFGKSPLMFTVAFTILIIIVIIFFVRWMWPSKETISQITRQEGIERLSTGSLETSFASNPSSFCASAGTMDTSDPWNSMYQAAKNDTTGNLEALTDYGKSDYSGLGRIMSGH